MATREEADELIKGWKIGLNFYDIPSHMHGGLVRYVEEGCPVGSFLTAVFSNDLVEAVATADEENIVRLRDYMYFLYNQMPIGAWGSPEKHKAWIQTGGLRNRLLIKTEEANA